MGGGLSLEANAKIHILRYTHDPYDDLCFNINSKLHNTFMIRFIANTAQYGGAIYVNDETYSGTCAINPKTECFFQVLALYDRAASGSILIDISNFFLSNCRPYISH